ncbi:MAG: hypothetical protein AAB581_00725 [Patescibacteria group bacterium]
MNSQKFINLFAIIIALGLIGFSFYFSKEKNYSIAPESALASRFNEFSQKGNSTCSGVFKDSIMGMTNGDHIKGSCCSPMSMHRYEEQVEGLKKYADIPEIPPDPYDVDAALAKELLAYYDFQLAPEEQAAYDYAMKHSHENGPCCCKCWRWYVYGGLAKKLINERGFAGEQIIDVWNLSDGCGGEGEHVQEHHM